MTHILLIKSFFIIGLSSICIFACKIIIKNVLKQRKIIKQNILFEKQLKETFDAWWRHLHCLGYDSYLGNKLDYDTQYRLYYHSVVELKDNKDKYLEKLLIDLHWSKFCKGVAYDFFVILKSTQKVEYDKFIMSLYKENYVSYLDELKNRYNENKKFVLNYFNTKYKNLPKDFFDVIGINEQEFFQMFKKWCSKNAKNDDNYLNEFFKTFTDKYNYAKETHNNHKNQHHSNHNTSKRNTVLNPHEILGVSQNATKKEIRSAYLKLSKMYHPDAGIEKSSVKFIELKNAYDVLMK